MSNPSILKNWLDHVASNFNSKLWVKENWNFTKK
jgi:putative NADPH-quinone reductase